MTVQARFVCESPGGGFYFAVAREVAHGSETKVETCVELVGEGEGFTRPALCRFALDRYGVAALEPESDDDSRAAYALGCREGGEGLPFAPRGLTIIVSPEPRAPTPAEIHAYFFGYALRSPATPRV